MYNIAQNDIHTLSGECEGLAHNMHACTDYEKQPSKHAREHIPNSKVVP